ncbi:SOS response-associated peptidase family protein [Novosphingobium resinovorum]|uniref:SOS response-associated peptidase family protein n=1 Tax=Novosphingobium resinovorum TaxID=158500 RepID=UPI002ED66F8B|nr:SOS response-associated peptidase family protein [Novosphingobium resinovorum]
MCNRARMKGEIETIWGSVAELFSEAPRDNRFDPQELRPRGRAYVMRQQDNLFGWYVMSWDVLGGKAAWPMTNVRNLALPQWRRLAERPENRCVVPLTEFCEFTPDKHDLGDGKPPLKGEMWFSVIDQPVFAVAGFWQQTESGNAFAMVTCDANSLVEPIHPKAMVTILEPSSVETWLSGSYEEIVSLQRPFDADKMVSHGPVFPTRGNRA